MMVAVTNQSLYQDRGSDEFVVRYTNAWVELPGKKRVARVNSKWWIFILSAGWKHDPGPAQAC